VREVPELRAVLRNPQLDPRTKSKLLEELAADAAEFDRLVAAEERRLKVELTTAIELSDEQAREIVRQIEQATGRTVEATRRVDPDLIGGLVLQADSLRVDASVRGRLNRLREELVPSR
jgi:F-type H+-transporting ATPase subunit delta